MRLMKYNVEASYCPGKNMLISDLLSRNPMENEDQKVQQEELEEAVECYASSVIAHMDPSTGRLKRAQEEDDVPSEVRQHTLAGWPSAHEVSEEVWVNRSSQDHLSVVDGILLFDDRIVVPEKLRQEMLTKIHEGHLGLHKSREAARASVWWPGLSTDLKKKIESCEFCQVNRPRQKSEPLLPTELPDGPWQKLGADILMWKQSSYLVIIDYYSRYLEILDLPNITSSMVIRKMKATFARHGLPCEIVTDGGTQFTSSEFAEFSKRYNFTHRVTSPHHPQSNGEAERAVRTAKHVLRQKEPCMALLSYRNAPLHGQAYSPAQLLMGRRLRTTLPTLSHHMKPQLPDREEVEHRNRMKKKKTKENYDTHMGSSSLPPLNPGDRVRVRTDADREWSPPMRVVGRHGPRSYWVESLTGPGRWVRARRHLQGPLPTTHAPVPAGTGVRVRAAVGADVTGAARVAVGGDSSQAAGAAGEAGTIPATAGGDDGETAAGGDSAGTVRAADGAFGGDDGEAAVGGDDRDAAAVGGDDRDAAAVGGDDRDAAAVGGDDRDAAAVGGDDRDAAAVGGDDRDAAAVGGDSAGTARAGAGADARADVPVTTRRGRRIRPPQRLDW